MKRKKPMTQRELAQKGGAATLKKYGKEYFSRMGKKGAASKLRKYGVDYFKKIRRIAIDKKKALQDKDKNTIDIQQEVC